MEIPAGQYLEGYVGDVAARLQDVASQLYDLDQSSSLSILQDAETYQGKTREVLRDVAADKAWLWAAYTAARERVDRARELVDGRNWDAARAELASPVDVPEAPPHDDVPELVGLIADTAKAVLEVALLVAPRIGEHLSVLSQARTRLGAVEEDAALVGLSHDAALLAARAAVNDAFDAVSVDPLAADPAAALAAVDAAHDLVEEAHEDLKRLPERLGQADRFLLELEVLITAGRSALDTAREKIHDPQGLLVPLASDVLTQGPQALRPWLDRLSRAAAEGDNRAALVGMRSWERMARQVRDRAERIVRANVAAVARRDELRGLVGALQAKAAASGLAEDAQAQALYDAAREVLWVAPCDLQEAEGRVDDYRRFLADR